MSQSQDKTQKPAGPDRDWAEELVRDPHKAVREWSALDPEQRLDQIIKAGALLREKLITLSPDARLMVRSLSADEFARTVIELGPEDSVGLLDLSTPTQLTFLFDLTGWREEKFSPARYQLWLPALMEAGPGPLSRWLKTADLEALALLFAFWFRVEKFLPSQDEQEPPDNLPSFTLDGVYYIEFHKQENAQFVAQVLAALKNGEPELYTRVLEAMLWEPASLLASEGLRWRNGRLADQGFPDRLEALELWAKNFPGELDWEKVPQKRHSHQLPGVKRSGREMDLLPGGLSLPTAAGRLDPGTREVILAEAAYVANCGAVALKADPLDPESVDLAARESLGLANLGLESMARGDDTLAMELASRVGLSALARKGASALRELNQRAHALLREGWLKGIPNNLHLFDAPLDRNLAGLLFTRPRFYDPNLEGGKEYRSFRGLADLELASRRLAQCEFWGRLLFEFMGLERKDLLALLTGRVWPEDNLEIKLSAVLGTWLARRALGGAGLDPLLPEELKPAVTALQKGLAGPLPAELEESVSGIADPGEAQLAAGLLRGVLASLRNEIGRVNPELPMDPRYVGGLVVRRAGDSE